MIKESMLLEFLLSVRSPLLSKTGSQLATLLLVHDVFILAVDEHGCEELVEV